MPDGTQIDDPSSLRGAGSGATELAGQTRSAGHLPVDETRAAARGFGGGQWDGDLGAALGGLADTWSDQVATLAMTCNTLGEQCTSTADNYTTTEAANVSVMTPRGGSGGGGTTPFG